MDVVRFVNEALSNADTQRTLEGNAKIIKNSALGHLHDIDQLLPLKGPRGPFKGPRGSFKRPRGPFKGPRGPLKGRGKHLRFSVF